MTLANPLNKITHMGDGVTTTFSYNFPIRRMADVRVYVEKSGTKTLLDPSLYTITNVGYQSAGGTVTYATSTGALAIGSNITIEREVPYTQNLSAIDAVTPEAVERALDNIVMQIQQVAGQLGYSSDVISGELTENKDRANKLAYYNSEGVISAATMTLAELTSKFTAIDKSIARNASELSSSIAKNNATIISAVNKLLNQLINGVIAATVKKVDNHIETSSNNYSKLAKQQAADKLALIKLIKYKIKCVEDKNKETNKKLTCAIDKVCEKLCELKKLYCELKKQFDEFVKNIPDCNGGNGGIIGLCDCDKIWQEITNIYDIIANLENSVKGIVWTVIDLAYNAEVGDEVEAVIVHGYYAVGDGGASKWVRSKIDDPITSTIEMPTVTDKRNQSWVLAEKEVRPQMFGAKANDIGFADLNTFAMKDMFDYAYLRGAEVKLGNTDWYLLDALNIDVPITINGEKDTNLIFVGQTAPASFSGITSNFGITDTTAYGKSPALLDMANNEYILGVVVNHSDVVLNNFTVSCVNEIADKFIAVSVSNVSDVVVNGVNNIKGAIGLSITGTMSVIEHIDATSDVKVINSYFTGSQRSVVVRGASSYLISEYSLDTAKRTITVKSPVRGAPTSVAINSTIVIKASGDEVLTPDFSFAGEVVDNYELNQLYTTTIAIPLGINITASFTDLLSKGAIYFIPTEHYNSINGINIDDSNFFSGTAEFSGYHVGNIVFTPTLEVRNDAAMIINEVENSFFQPKLKYMSYISSSKFKEDSPTNSPVPTRFVISTRTNNCFVDTQKGIVNEWGDFSPIVQNASAKEYYGVEAWQARNVKVRSVFLTLAATYINDSNLLGDKDPASLLIPDFEIHAGQGEPEGVIYAPEGSIFWLYNKTATEKLLYRKSTDLTQNVGWKLLRFFDSEAQKQIDDMQKDINDIKDQITNIYNILNGLQDGLDKLWKEILSVIGGAGNEYDGNKVTNLYEAILKLIRDSINNALYGCLPMQFPQVPNTICSLSPLVQGTDANGCTKIYAKPVNGIQLSISSLGDFYPMGTIGELNASINPYSATELSTAIQTGTINRTRLNLSRLSLNTVTAACGMYVEIAETILPNITGTVNQQSQIIIAINGVLSLVPTTTVIYGFSQTLTTFGSWYDTKTVFIPQGTTTIETFAVSWAAYQFVPIPIIIGVGGNYGNASIIKIAEG